MGGRLGVLVIAFLVCVPEWSDVKGQSPARKGAEGVAYLAASTDQLPSAVALKIPPKQRTSRS